MNCFNSIQGLNKEDETKGYNSIIDFMLSEIKSELSKRERASYEVIDVCNVKGILYVTINIPEWQNMMNNLLYQMDKRISFKLENSNVSYVLFYKVEQNIYAMTAGYGKHLIDKYILKSWGLYLMPKFLGDDMGVIKQVKENNLYGNTLSLSKANRNSTNIKYEKNMSSIFKELSIEVDDELLTQNGLDTPKKKDSKKKTTGILLKDSLNVRNSMSIENLKDFLNKLNDVEKKTDKYSMGYFLSSSKLGFHNSELFMKFIEDIKDGFWDKINLIGDDYETYYRDVSKYIVSDEKGIEIINTENPITINELMEKVKKTKYFSKTGLEKVLKKWTISTKSSSGRMVLYPTVLFTMLQGYVEYGNNKIPCYLMQGEWYCFNDRYIELLSDEFKKLLSTYDGKTRELMSKYQLKATGDVENDENEYNKTFKVRNDVIVAHKAIIDNFEIADLIYWDDENLYLMCNKAKFDGSGCRDLTNQMWASANYFQANLSSNKKNDFLKQFYEKINENYRASSDIFPVGEGEFINLFDKNIYYVAGYLTGCNVRSKSSYAKYLTIDSYKKNGKYGIQLYLYEFELTMNCIVYLVLFYVKEYCYECKRQRSIKYAVGTDSYIVR